MHRQSRVISHQVPSWFHKLPIIISIILKNFLLSCYSPRISEEDCGHFIQCSFTYKPMICDFPTEDAFFLNSDLANNKERQ